MRPASGTKHVTHEPYPFLDDQATRAQRVPRCVNHPRFETASPQIVPILQQEVGCDRFWPQAQFYQWQQPPHQLAPAARRAKPRFPSGHSLCIGAVDGDGSACQPAQCCNAAIMVEVSVGDENELEVARSQCLQVSQNGSLLMRQSGVYEHPPRFTFEQVYLR